MYMAVICFEKMSGVPAAKHGYELARELLSVRKARELKYRVVRKRVRGDAHRRVAELLRRDAWACTSMHVSNPSIARLELLSRSVESLARAAHGREVSVLILGAQSIANPQRVFARLRELGRGLGLHIHRVEMRSSTSVEGMQLADVLVGLCREGLVPWIHSIISDDE